MSLLDCIQASINDVEGGKDTKEGADMVRRNLPGGNLWQIRLVLARFVFEQVQLMLDPDAPSYQRAKERRTKRETGTGYLWAPGEPTPGLAG